MSTPAAAALSEAGGAPAAGSSGGGAPSGAGNGTVTPAVPGAGPAANGFWKDWNAPDQKETRDWAANKNYADPFTLAKSARDWETQAATLRAGKGYPTAGADGKVDPNAVKAWNALNGVPESPDKYEIPTPENNPYPQFKTYMAQALHEAGVPAAMAPALAKGYEAALSKMETELRAQEDNQSTLALKELESQWGSNYKERMALAARGLDWFSKEMGGMNDVQKRVMESMLGTPKFLTAMWKLGAANGEMGFASSDQHGSSFAAGGAAEAQAELDALMAKRSSGAISNLEWADIAKPGGKFDQLRDKIVAGMAQQG